MKPQPSTFLSRPSCHHIHPSGRRCRFPVLSDALFCVHHIHSQVAATPIPDVDLSRHFGPDPLNLRSACEINDFLCSLAILMIENRTPPVARRCSPTSPASNSARSRQSITNSAIPTKRSRASSSTAQRHSNPRSEIESKQTFRLRLARTHSNRRPNEHIARRSRKTNRRPPGMQRIGSFVGAGFTPPGRSGPQWIRKASSDPERLSTAAIDGVGVLTKRYSVRRAKSILFQAATSSAQQT
jgi:hypothetical protein